MSEAPCVRLRAEDDHRNVMLARNLAKHFDSVHARHIEIEGDHVRMQFLDFFQADQPSMAVPTTSMEGSRCNTCGISFRIKRGIIHNEDANFFAHAMAPTGGILEK